MLKRILSFLLLAALYVAAAKLGLLVSFVRDNVTLVWPPSGLALAALILGGRRLWPGVALGAVLATWSTGAPWSFALITGVGNTLEALLAAHWFLRPPGCRPQLDRLRDVCVLVGPCAFLATMVAAGCGAWGLWVNGMIPGAVVPSVGAIWWLGDLMGILLLTPAILVWSSRVEGEASSAPAGEGLLLGLGMLLVAAVVYGGLWAEGAQGPLSYAAFPFIIWGALRFGPRGAATTILVGSGVAIWGTVHGAGPFQHLSVHYSLFYLHGFLGALVLTGLFLAAGRQERAQALENLTRLNQELEHRVEARTRELSDTVALLQKEITERRKVTEEVRTLSGMLPICAHCKKIRNDKGYWERLEAYIGSRSGARFSHGLCPECIAELYPEYLDQLGTCGGGAPPGAGSDAGL